MKTKKIFSLALVCFVVIACKKTNQSNTLNLPAQPQVSDKPHRAKEFHLIDTVKLGSKMYVYQLDRVSSDSLGIVTDENGEKFVDNFYQLNIKRNGAPFFDKRFTKNLLAPQLDKGFKKNGILDGFRFIAAKEGQLFFSLCVSYPESDMSAPFILTIGPDGSYSLRPDNMMDLEETDNAMGV